MLITAAFDNIDHNETSSTLSGHFHGTRIDNLIEKEIITYSFLKLITKKKKKWLKFIDDTKSTKAKASEKSCNWAAYYQENKAQKLQMPCSSVPLPLINENINSPAMVNHFMTVIQKVVH